MVWHRILEYMYILRHCLGSITTHFIDIYALPGLNELNHMISGGCWLIQCHVYEKSLLCPHRELCLCTQYFGVANNSALYKNFLHIFFYSERPRNVEIVMATRYPTANPGIPDQTWRSTQRDLRHLLASWHVNTFRITDPSWGESYGRRWIPLTRASKFLWKFGQLYIFVKIG